MDRLISAFWFALELAYCFLFWQAFIPMTATKRKRRCLLCTAWVFTFFYTNLGLNQILKICISFFVFLVIIRLLFDGSLHRHIFVIVLGFAVSAIIDMGFVYGISSFLGMSLEEFTRRQVFYVTAVTTGKLFSVFFAWMFQRYRAFKHFQTIEKKWLLLSLFFPLVSFAMILVVFDSNKGNRDLSLAAFVFSGILCIANIAIIYLLNIMEKSTNNRQENALLKQQMDIQTSSILALEKSYRAQRQATHDFRNQLQTINDLLINNNTQTALEYVQQLQGMQTTRIFSVNTHHPIIDAIMNHKYQIAQEMGIDVHVQVNDLSSVNLSTDILVVLLTNLLDNAIEACVKLPTARAIHCRIFATDSIYIAIRNTSSPVSISHNCISTTKEPQEDHGYGLSRVQHILKQLNAEFAFTYDNGWFEFVAEIPKI